MDGNCSICAVVTHVDSKLYNVMRGGSITCTETDGETSVGIMLRTGVLFDAGHYSGCENPMNMFGDAKMKVFNLFCFQSLQCIYLGIVLDFMGCVFVIGVNPRTPPPLPLLSGGGGRGGSGLSGFFPKLPPVPTPPPPPLYYGYGFQL